jgi:redox-sensitive bicupin YhaK (pirin superfamily)
MDKLRQVKRIVTGHATVDGAGVKLVRVLGRDDVQDFDPFLMLDAFDSTDPKDYLKGFPWHPHRGIETITYLISGQIEHGDSLGNSGVIGEGECQWMTAGSGIIHQEMPKASERLWGVQLWLNMPAVEKMATPHYNSITKALIPAVQEDGVTVCVISGVYRGIIGGTRGAYLQPQFLDVTLMPDVRWQACAKDGCARAHTDEGTLFVYVLSGSGRFGPEPGKIVEAKHAALFDEGNVLRACAGKEGVRFLLLCGQPLREPVAWGGPIVMNTPAELRLAFKELDEGTFIKQRA